MIRLLHTADWHVGRTLARQSRLDEERAVLREIGQIATDEAVDVVLIAGDVFEHAAPGPDAEAIVYDALVDLHRRGLHVVVVPGNHDHPRRWDALRPLLGAFSIQVQPAVRAPDKGGVVEVAVRDGRLQVAALPWVAERRLTGAAELMGLEEQPYASYADGMARLVAALCARLDPRQPSVLLAHLFVSGALLGGGERSLTVGDLYAVTGQAFPAHVQYAALGHVHRAQDLPGGVPARYAGSVLQLDFGEVGQDKSVAIVELEPGAPARVRTVPLRSGRRLVDVRGSIEGLEQRRDELDDAFLRVTLECAGPRPGLADEVRELLPNAIEVRLDYPREDAPRRAADLRRMTPRDLYARYLARDGAAVDESRVELFARVMGEIDADATD